MHTSIPDHPLAMRVSVSDDTLTVDLVDGRTLMVPLVWFPRLQVASPSDRANWRLIGQGVGTHWDAIDEDISVRGLLMPSAGRGERAPA
jgi:hypothetical protein